MNIWWRVAGLIVGLFYLAGCSTYRQVEVVMTGGQFEGGALEGLIGHDVRLTARDGTVLSGTLIDDDGQTLTVAKITRGYEGELFTTEATMEYADMIKVEIREDNDAATAGVVVLVVGGIILIIVGLSVQSSMDGMWGAKNYETGIISPPSPPVHREFGAHHPG